MSNLTIRERTSRGVTIIALDGRITLGDTNRQLHNAIRRLVEEGKTQVVLDLGKVTYIDSTGLGELVSGFSTLKANNGALKLLNVPGKVMDLMVMTKLYTVFEIHEEEINAVNSFDVPAESITRPLDASFAADARANRPIH